MKNLIERMRTIIDSETESFRRFKDMEEKTGLKADAWKNFYNSRQRPTAEMIELVGKSWPHLAFWLITGVDDPEHGHQKIDAYKPIKNKVATQYFVQKIKSEAASERFDEAMKSARLVKEVEGENAGSMRYVLDDPKIFVDWMTQSKTCNQLFIEREREDKEIIEKAIEDKSEAVGIEFSENAKLYAPSTDS